MSLSEGALTRVQFAFSRKLWRIAPAWSVLAGALASGWAPTDASAILRLGAAIALGDLAWGSLRPHASGRAGQMRRPDGAAPNLPYSISDAPLTRFLQSLAAHTGMSASAAWQSLAVGLALTLGLSLLLGPVAVALSGSGLLLIALVWQWQAHRRESPALGLAILDVAWPWLLGASVQDAMVWQARGWPGLLGVLGAFVLLQWGILRAQQGNQVASVGVWVGQLAVLVALVATKQAWVSALVAAAFAAPSWWLLRRDPTGIRRALPWWWFAFLVAAIGLT